MGSAGREGRQSEKTFGEILALMRSLTIEVWLPRADDAQETAAMIKRRLDQMVAEMKAESFTVPPPYQDRPRGLVQSQDNTFDEDPKR